MPLHMSQFPIPPEPRPPSPWRSPDETPPPRQEAFLALDTGDNCGAGLDEAYRIAWFDPDRHVWQLIDAENWAGGDTMAVGSPWLLAWMPIPQLPERA